MSTQPFIGELSIVAFNFAPAGWALCNGQLLPIAQNEALFSLLGTTYGGNGETTFALPDLRGRLALHAGIGPGLSVRSLGEHGGAERVVLTKAQLPAHQHGQPGGGLKTSSNPGGRVPSNGGAYSAPKSGVHMTPTDPVGGGQAHENMSPFLVLNVIIALQGTFPTPG